MKKVKLIGAICIVVFTSCKKYEHTCHCITERFDGFSGLTLESDITVKGKKNEGEELCEAKNETKQLSGGYETTTCHLK